MGVLIVHQKETAPAF